MLKFFIPMSIRKKIILVYSICIGIFIVLNLIIYSGYIKKILNEFEKQNIIESVNRLKKILALEEENLLNMTKDWAAWNEAWLYLQDKNPAFVSNNLTVETWINNKLYLLSYIDMEGNVKFSGCYDEKINKLNQCEEELIKKIFSRYKATQQTSGYTGITFQKEIPLILAVFPVMKSSYIGPIVGYLIMGRLINQEKERVIKEILSLNSFRVQNLDSLSKTKQQEFLSGSFPLIKEFGKDYEVSIVNNDFFGEKKVLISFNSSKKFLFTVQNIEILVLINLMIWILSGVVLYFTVKKSIIKRILKLTSKLQEVEQDRGYTAKPLYDEIDYLQRVIDQYTKTLQKHISQIEEDSKIYQTIAERSEEIIVFFSKSGDIIYANPKAIDYLGNESFTISNEKVKSFMKDFLSQKDEETTSWKEIKLPDGTCLSAWIIPIDRTKGTMLFIAHDVTLYKRERDKIFEIAIRDPLTSLYNRNFIEDALKRAIGSAKRGEIYSLLFIDMDDLKKINDSFGHLSGDNAIRAVSKAIKNNIRESDIAARWGGDEFIVLLKGDIEGAKAVAERIFSSIKNIKLDFGGQVINLSVSIGITTIDGTKNMETVIKEADHYTYLAKEEGKGKIKSFQ
ncbi:diguanylate cyclase (GGDEF) domain-containing protein [Thermodesulfovibrio aggregans]|uniref:diguanylate cyclase n=2 Tax=Thermodesulfovibrio aggregans TaxID=86166 RepID=A0A0U9HXL3_9BACT|nr:diguanylate cyclase (GGDEF) domain-containing protein [Thermodesulfovibrio aggregans]